MGSINHVENDDNIVIVDGSGSSTVLDKRTNENYDVDYFVRVSDRKLNGSLSVEEVRDYLRDRDIPVVEDLGTENVSFPIEFTDGDHLEDGTLLKLEREISKRLEDVFGEEPKLPSMETNRHWKVDEDGDIELEKIEYNGEEYTKD